jgi:hypothetical protein
MNRNRPEAPDAHRGTTRCRPRSRRARAAEAVPRPLRPPPGSPGRRAPRPRQPACIRPRSAPSPDSRGPPARPLMDVGGFDVVGEPRPASTLVNLQAAQQVSNAATRLPGARRTRMTALRQTRRETDVNEELHADWRSGSSRSRTASAAKRSASATSSRSRCGRSAFKGHFASRSTAVTECYSIATSSTALPRVRRADRPGAPDASHSLQLAPYWRPRRKIPCQMTWQGC